MSLIQMQKTWDLRKVWIMREIVERYLNGEISWNVMLSDLTFATESFNQTMAVIKLENGYFSNMDEFLKACEVKDII